MKNFARLFLMTFMVLSYMACHDELSDFDSSVQLKSQIDEKKVVTDAESWFNSNPGENNYLILEYMERIDWPQAVVFKHDTATVVEVPIKIKSRYLAKIKGTDNLNVEHRLLIVMKNDVTYSLLEFLISDDNKENLQNIKKINYGNLKESFIGTVVFVDNQNETVKTKNYSSQIQATAVNLKSMELHCLCIFEIFSDGSRELVSVLYCYYVDSGSGSGGGSAGSSSTTDDCNCNVCTVCGGCLDQPRLKSLPYPGDGETEEGSVVCPLCSCPEIIEDPSFENSVAACVKGKLENGSILSTLLAGFDLNQSLIDVTYKVGNLDGANGECYLNGTRIEITIDQDMLNATSMQLANTILHETFHAYIYGKLYDSELHTGLCPEPNFENDFEAYEQQFGDQSQHNYMANKYMEYMYSGLQNYFYGESYRNNFLNYVGDMTQWYGEENLIECLAWSGLKRTVAWSEYYGNQTNKTKYDETIKFIVPVLSKENCNN